MPFKMSHSSMTRLMGVNPKLVEVVKLALKLTKVDFAVGYGVRSREEQYELWRKCHNKDGTPIKGAKWVTSRNGTPKGQTTPEGSPGTGESLHQDGNAVDLFAINGGKISWNEKDYEPIGEAMFAAAKRLKTEIEWGAHWPPKNREYVHFQLKGKE